jgi:hypothetical protein
MAISRIQTVEKGTGGSGSDPITTGNFGSSVTSGNLIVVCIRTNAVAVAGVTDTVGTTYAQADTYNALNPPAYVFWGAAGGSGTNAVTVDLSASSNYTWILAAEYSPAGAWSEDTSVNGRMGSADTDIAASAITTTQAEELIVMMASSTTVFTSSAGTDFTLVAGDVAVGETGFALGGVQQRITSGTLSSYVAHMTASASAQCNYVVAAFIPPVSTGNRRRRLLLCGSK